MKILFVSGQFYPKIVGSGTIAYLMAKELASRGHDITVAVDREIQDLSYAVHYPFHVVYINDLKDFVTGKAGFRKPTEQLLAHINENNFDIIHVFSFMPMLVISLIRELFSPPIVFTFWNTPNKHERAIGYYTNADLDIQLAKSIISMGKYSQVIVGSKAYYNAAIELGVKEEALSFSYIGIDQDEFVLDLEKNQGIDLNQYFTTTETASEKLITLPGRITKQKGILEAVQALSLVNKVIPAKLLLTGMADPYNKRFAKQVIETAKELNIEDKIIVPKKVIPRSHLPVVLEKSGVVITPSYYEGLGLSAVEALVVGAPLIATNVTGLNEVVKHGQNAIVVEAKNSDQLAEAIIEILTNKQLNLQLRERARDSAKKFDSKKFTNFAISVYQNLKNNQI